MNDRNREKWTLEIFNYCHLLRLDCGFIARLKLIIVDKNLEKLQLQPNLSCGYCNPSVTDNYTLVLIVEKNKKYLRTE